MKYNYNENIDWYSIILIVRKHGLRKSARELGIAYQVLYTIENGSSPDFYLGNRLLRFWLEKTGKRPDEIPTLNCKPAIEQAFLLLE